MEAAFRSDVEWRSGPHHAARVRERFVGGEFASRTDQGARVPIDRKSRW